MGLESYFESGLDSVPVEGDEYLDVLREHFANEVSDRLGMHIEAGVLDAVTCFNAAGFRTSMSCEGHSEKRGLPFAWLAFESEFMSTPEGQEYNDLNRKYTDFCKSTKKDKQKDADDKDFPDILRLIELRRQVSEASHRLKDELNALLDEFYSKQGSTGFDYGISGSFPSVRIEPKEAIQMDREWLAHAPTADGRRSKLAYEDFTDDTRRDFVEKSRQEMQRLTTFVKDKFLEEKQRE